MQVGFVSSWDTGATEFLLPNDCEVVLVVDLMNSVTPVNQVDSNINCGIISDTGELSAAVYPLSSPYISEPSLILHDFSNISSLSNGNIDLSFIFNDIAVAQDS